MSLARRLAEIAAKKLLDKAGKTLLKRTDIINAFKAGLDNAIYDHPLGEYYTRTGNIRKSVKFKRQVSSKNIRSVRVYIDGNTLANLPNINGPKHQKDYSKYVAHDPTNTVSGKGFFPFSKKHIFNFVIKDLVRQGIM